MCTTHSDRPGAKSSASSLLPAGGLCASVRAHAQGLHVFAATPPVRVREVHAHQRLLDPSPFLSCARKDDPVFSVCGGSPNSEPLHRPVLIVHHQHESFCCPLVILLLGFSMPLVWLLGCWYVMHALSLAVSLFLSVALFQSPPPSPPRHPTALCPGHSAARVLDVTHELVHARAWRRTLPSGTPRAGIPSHHRVRCGCWGKCL